MPWGTRVQCVSPVWVLGMLLSVIPSIYAASTVIECDWPGLGSYLRQCSETIRISRREEAPLFALGFVDRDISKVQALSGLVFDFDDNPESDWTLLMGWLQSTGYAAFGYRSFNAGRPGYEGQLRARLIFPTARDMSPAEFRIVWAAVRNSFPCKADDQCKNENRFYWPPTNGSPLLEFPGGCIPVEPLLHYQPAVAQRPAVLALAAPRESIGRAELNSLAQSLQRKQSQNLQIAGRALAKAMLGQAFAIKGQRNSLLFELAGYIAEKYPFCDAEEVGEYFGPALSLMAEVDNDPNNPPPGVADVVTMIQRHQHRTQAQALDKQAFARAVAGAQQAEAERNGHPQGPPPVGGAQPVDATDPTDWPPILQRGSFYWFREHAMGVNGLVPVGYSKPYHREDATIEVLRRFEPIGLQLRDDKGEAQKFLRTLQDYSEPIDHVVSDLTATSNRYDRSSRTLIQATAVRRPLAPVQDPEVDTWLRLLAKEQYDLLADWLATVLTLDRPSAAIYMVGKTGAGKSLFGHSVASLFLEPVTTLEDMTGNFNEKIQYNPIVFADERIPERATFAWLREFIQSTTRKINEKFKPPVVCKGACRLIIGANPERDFFQVRSITRDAMEAVIKRFIRIETDDDASRYLQSVDARSFYLEHRFAKHIHWLVQNRPVNFGSRFAVEGQAKELAKELRTPNQDTVAEVLLEYLTDPKRFDMRGDFGLLIKDLELLVTAQGVVNAAKVIWTQPRFRSTAEVSAVLATFGVSKRSVRPPKGDPRYYHVIDLSALWAYALEYGYELERLQRNLNMNTGVQAAPQQPPAQSNVHPFPARSA